MTRNEYLLLLIFLIIAVFILSRTGSDECKDCNPGSHELFKPNNLGNPETDLLDFLSDDHLAYDRDQPSVTHSPVSVKISNKELINILTRIKKMIIEKIIGYAKICQTMGGDQGKFSDGMKNMTLQCYPSTCDIADDIIDSIAILIQTYMKQRVNVNLNYDAIYNDLYSNLNLKEGVLEPLQFSELYTIHGAQYFNESMLSQKVYHNLKIRNVLISILDRRNITIDADTDQHIY